MNESTSDDDQHFNHIAARRRKDYPRTYLTDLTLSKVRELVGHAGDGQ